MCFSSDTIGQGVAYIVHATQGFFSKFKVHEKEPCADYKHSIAYSFFDPAVVGNKVPLYVVGVALAAILSFTMVWTIARLRDCVVPTAKGIPPSMSEKLVEDGEKLCITISKESATRA
jgi:hypothetical protein